MMSEVNERQLNFLIIKLANKLEDDSRAENWLDLIFCLGQFPSFLVSVSIEDNQGMWSKYETILKKLLRLQDNENL